MFHQECSKSEKSAITINENLNLTPFLVSKVTLYAKMYFFFNSFVNHSAPVSGAR